MAATEGIKLVSFAESGNQDIANQIAAHHITIRLDQLENEGNTFADGLYGSQTDLKGAQEHYVDRGGDLVYAVAQDGSIAGFAAIKRESPQAPDAKFTRMAVLPAYRRQGLGSAIVRATLSRAADLGVRTVELKTGEREKARPMYQKAGFVVVGIEPKEGDTFDYVMRLDDLSAYNGRGACQ